MSKVLTFDRIQAGLQALKKLGIQRETFTVLGVELTIATVDSKAHQEINTYVTSYMQAYEEGDGDSAYNFDATLDFFLVRKVEVLSHAILKMGDLDFEGVEWVETGDKHPDNSSKVKVAKSKFLRDLLMGVDQTVVDVAYRKYAELIELAESRSVEGVVFRDLEDELSKARATVARLEDELGKGKEEGNDTEDGEKVEEVLTEESVRDRMFGVVSEEESVALGDRSILSELEAEPVTVEEPVERIQAGSTTFVRLDEPDAPLSDEEETYLRAQEELHQQRYGEPRQPLNQTPPQLHSGTLPSQGGPRRVVRGSQALPPDFEIHQGIHSDDT